MNADAARETSVPRKVAIAIVAHPDDIEFMIAGTLLHLCDRGWETHYVTLANGSYGSRNLTSEEIIAVRQQEAKRGAAALGAQWHPSYDDDLELVYSVPFLRKVTALLREVEPSIVLTQAPEDYMDDHIEAARIVASAAFVRCMPNFVTDPDRPATYQDVTVYHALPHGLRNKLRRNIQAGAYVDIASVHDRKRAALECHESQAAWLAESQGFGSYVDVMSDMSRAVGRQSGIFELAEGWRRHSSLGYSSVEQDPLADALGSLYRVNEAYETSLQAMD
jgi:LmbE family N-acetylglucosaminyl deacetylase